MENNSQDTISDRDAFVQKAFLGKSVILFHSESTVYLAFLETTGDDKMTAVVSEFMGHREEKLAGIVSAAMELVFQSIWTDRGAIGSNVYQILGIEEETDHE